MDEQALSRIEQTLQDTLELVEENNKLLLSLQRTARWSFWGKLVLWLVVLILPLIVLGPLLKAFAPALTGGQSSTGVFGLPSTDQVQELINTYQGLQQ